MAFLRIYENDVARVADHFTLSETEVVAALAYYHRNKKYVDARLILNEA